jgi:acylphosphatase
MQRVSFRVRIEGRVQGVWYRGWTLEQARRRGLAGWVRNRADGSVEALFCGPETLVQDIIAACREGPPGAVVTAVSVDPAPFPDGDGFHQWPTI